MPCDTPLATELALRATEVERGDGAARGHRGRHLHPDPPPHDSHLGDSHIAKVVGDQIVHDTTAIYRLPSLVPANTVAFGGPWDAHAEEAPAGIAAALELQLTAPDVYVLLGGHGTMTVLCDGVVQRTIPVTGIANLYSCSAS